MGIRYYAYPVGAADTAQAAANPAKFVAADPLADAWGLAQVDGPVWVMTDRPRPRMLYLDKCWSMLQSFTMRGRDPRPAYRLVEGDVRHHPEGLLKALSPEDVARIADDLDSVTDDEIAAFRQEISIA